MRPLKKIFFLLLAILLGIFIVFGVLVYTQQDALKQKALNELNKTLAVPVGVDEVTISLKKFPKASVLFNTVYCKGYGGGNTDTLLYARQAYFQFSLWSVFNDELTIQGISVEDGVLDIKMPKDALPNYQIWKDNDSVSSTSLVNLDLVELLNMRVNFWHEKSEVRFSSFQNKVEASVLVGKKGFEVQGSHIGLLNNLWVGNEEFAKGFEHSNQLTVFVHGDTIELKEGEAEINDLKASYSLFSTAEQIRFDAVSRADFALEKIWEQALKQGWTAFPEYNFTGTANAKFNYQSSAKSTKYSVVGDVRDAGFASKNVQVKNVSGAYQVSSNNGVVHVSSPNFKAKYPSGAVMGSIAIENIDRPKVVADFTADLSLEDLHSILHVDTLENTQGKISITASFENQFRSFDDIKPADLLRASVNGSVAFEEVKFKVKNSKTKVENLRGSIALNNKTVKIKELYFGVGNSDVFIDGSVSNLLNWLFFKEQKMGISGRLVSQEFDLGDFVRKTSVTTASNEGYDLSLVNNVDVRLGLEIMAFRFNTFSATNISGFFTGDDGSFMANNVKLNTCGGSLSGSVSLNTRVFPYPATTRFTATSVSISQLFKGFDNFGQTTLTHKELSGIADAEVEANGTFNQQLASNTNSIKAVAKLSIDKGTLTNFEPMLALSDYAEIDALKEVRFDALQNEISINAGVIYIPRMDIKSNVLDLQLAGTHTLENNIDYTIRLRLGDVLFNKRKNKGGAGEFDDYLTEVSQKDDPNIFVKMTGSVDNPKIGLDQEALGQSIKKDVKKQGEELKDIFKKEDKKKKKQKGTGIQFTWPEEDDG